MRERVSFFMLSIFITGILLYAHNIVLRQHEYVNSLNTDIALLEGEILCLNRQTHLIKKLHNLAMGSSSVCFKSEIKPEEYEFIFDRMKASGLKGTGNDIYLAEKTYNVNGLFIAAVAYHESDGGTSMIAINNNNLFGLNATDGIPGSAFYFENKGASVDCMAALLNRHYLSRGSCYYHGEKPVDIGVHYASDPEWASKTCSIMQLMLACLWRNE